MALINVDQHLAGLGILMAPCRRGPHRRPNRKGPASAKAHAVANAPMPSARVDSATVRGGWPRCEP